MQSGSNQGSNVKIEIQKTLVSINQLASKIKNEVHVIEELVRENGGLHTGIINANKTLTAVAENMGINVEDVLSNDEKEKEMQFILRNTVSSAAFKEKIAAYLRNN